MFDSFVVFDDADTLFDDFIGYAFVGHDLIVGRKGYRDYLNDSASGIRPGEDGSYFLCSSNDSRCVFSSDFNGNQRIFYYACQGHWAVSNSFNLLLEHVIRKGWSTTFNGVSALSFQLTGNVGRTLVGSSTLIEEIHLVPTKCYLEINRFTGECRELPVKNWVTGRESYSELLSACCSVWASRAYSILTYTDGLADVTGGRDSRVIFALISRVIDSFPELKNRINFRSSEVHKEDFDVAEVLVSHKGLALNRQGFVKDNSLSPEDSYWLWKVGNLGVYYPVYFPFSNHTVPQIRFYGAGGENYRPFFEEKSIEEIVRRKSRKIEAPKREKYIEFFINDVKKATSLHSENVPDVVAFYREYRGRFHFGRHTHYNFMISPLSSKYSDALASVCSKEDILNSQVLFDLAFTFDPTIALMPYDSLEKQPSVEHVRKCTGRADVDVNMATDGKVYGWNAIEESFSYAPKAKDNTTCFNFFMKDLKRAVDSEGVREFFPHIDFQTVIGIASEAERLGRFPHANYAAVAAQMITLNMVISPS